MVQGMPQSVRADDELAYEPDSDTVTRPTIGGEEGTSTLRLIATEGRRLLVLVKPRTPPESQPRIGFTGASHF